VRLLQAWRWYGPNDPVTLSAIRQTGAEGIVTALHQIPHGEVWPVEAIRERQEQLRCHGYRWDVVESVTVHEDIKSRSGDWRRWVEHYKTTLRNLAACGIQVVTYNFMPVTDWIRTDLAYPMPDGSNALAFDWVDLAVFDIHLLERPHAADSYPAEIASEAERRFASAGERRLEELAGMVLYGIPGERKRTIPELRVLLERFVGMDRAALQSHLTEFLAEVVPVAEECGIRLAIHPDDPPYDLLGMPRGLRNAEDVDVVLSGADSEANGICFCAGSFGVNPENDLPAMVRRIGTRVHFAHLRNTRRDATGNFHEADHLDGDTDMHAVMRELLLIQQRVSHSIPFRPDHGHEMLDDIGRDHFPGYSCLGRMRGLAELRGLELAVRRENGWG
jgi:mannonate dehydratase